MELSLDTAGERASIALSECGSLLAESTWTCRSNHSVEVLPAIDVLLGMVGAGRGALTAIFICSGPGSYGGLRAGLSLGMALASGLGVDALGVGRLEIEAYQQIAFPGPVCPIHRAGRGEIAWATYRGWDGDVKELQPPQICWPDEMRERAPSGALFCGEIDAELAEMLRDRDPAVAIVVGNGAVRRAGALAELGWRRYQAGVRAPQGYVEPLYLREPQITKARHSLWAGTPGSGPGRLDARGQSA